MTKSELIRLIAANNSDLSLKESDKLVNVVFGEISNALAEGRRIELRGFGAFSTRERDERTARNPKTGEQVKLEKRKSIYFRAGKEMNEKLNA